MADLKTAKAGAKIEAGSPVFESPRKGIIARFARWLHTHKRFQRRFIYNLGYCVLPYLVHPYDMRGRVTTDNELSRLFGTVIAENEDGTYIMRIGGQDKS